MYRYGRALMIFGGAPVVVFVAVAAFVFCLSTTLSPRTPNGMSAIRIRSANLEAARAQAVRYRAVGVLVLRAVFMLVLMRIVARERKGHFELHLGRQEASVF